MAELHRLVVSNLLVLDEAILFEVLLALLLLLRLEVRRVGCVALLTVAVDRMQRAERALCTEKVVSLYPLPPDLPMMTLDLFIDLGLFHDDNLVDASLTSGSNYADV